MTGCMRGHRSIDQGDCCWRARSKRRRVCGDAGSDRGRSNQGWRFGGGDISACRRPLCSAECEDEWSALAGWLRCHPRAWSRLEACEVGPAAESTPGARLRTRDSTHLALPDSFDSYLASLASKPRQIFRKRLRRAEPSRRALRYSGYRHPKRRCDRSVPAPSPSAGTRQKQAPSKYGRPLGRTARGARHRRHH